MLNLLLTFYNYSFKNFTHALIEWTFVCEVKEKGDIEQRYLFDSLEA